MAKKAHPLRVVLSLRVAFALASGLVVALSVFAGAAMAQNPVPFIDQPLIPDAVRPGGAGFTVTVNGTGFVPGAVVRWNGSARVTTFISRSKLTAAILATDIAKAVTASVTVVNPGPGGVPSNVAYFSVAAPVTSISLSTMAFGVGSEPFAVGTGDFNGDRNLDLVVANHDSDSVSVLLGNGNGTFKPAVNYTAGANPFWVAVGDFNGDGNSDIVVANIDSDNVSVFLGKGDGAFQAAVNYPTGTNPVSVAVGDFNGDGKLDLAVADSNCIAGGSPCGPPGFVSILIGKGDGAFHAHVDYAITEGASSVTVGDFNGDGKLDLAVAAGANGPGTEVSVLLGNGDGTFRRPVNYTVGVNPTVIATADFNKDGNLDLAVVNSGSPDNVSVGSVSILLGNGDGTFKPHVDYPTGAFPFGSLGVADLNADRSLDLIVANTNSNTLSILLGNGNGTFRPQSQLQFGAGTTPNGLVMGDFNKDGRLDVAVADRGPGAVSVLLQAPTVALSKTGLKFPAQLVGTGSASQTTTLTNTGYLTLKISSLSIDGTNATDFGQTNTCDSNLAVGASCTISITFMPTHVGPRTASVSITDNGVGSPQSIGLSGTGVVSGPNVTLSRTSLTFATQLVGTTSPAQSVTLGNYGTVTLNITSITASGDFSETHTCGPSLEPLASCTISVTFKPMQRGTRTGSLSIADNAPGSPQTMSLHGTGTVVNLSPASLPFGSVKVGKSSTMTTTLTNAGSTTLSIIGIMITGSSYFSQTNTCGTSVGTGKSCTITVTFAPKTVGSFSADVSVSDNGGGSPQQVSLSGAGIKGGASGLAVRSALVTNTTAAVPSTTGPSIVGTSVMDLLDSTRDDPFPADGTKRELLVRFWYPASSSQGCKLAAYTSPAVWRYSSQLVGIPLPEVRTNSCLDAPITRGSHPVILFTHGYTGTFTDYTFLFEDLASRGYVVASVDHTYEATAVEFPDGGFVESVFGSHLAEDSLRSDDQGYSLAMSVRLRDLKFVLNELEHLNVGAKSPFAGKLDMSRVALAGHSLGGLAALLSVEQEPRFRAGVVIDGDVSDAWVRPTETPILIMAMGRVQWSDNECRLWGNLRSTRLAVNLRGAEHLTPSDAVWLAKGAVKTGAMGPEKTIAAIRDYIAAFLDANLRGKSRGPLLSGPSSDYPDAAVTTQKQALCGRR